MQCVVSVLVAGWPWTTSGSRWHPFLPFSPLRNLRTQKGTSLSRISTSRLVLSGALWDGLPEIELNLIQMPASVVRNRSNAHSSLAQRQPSHLSDKQKSNKVSIEVPCILIDEPRSPRRFPHSLLVSQVLQPCNPLTSINGLGIIC